MPSMLLFISQISIVRRKTREMNNNAPTTFIFPLE